MNNIRVGFALCGSFCTFSRVIPQIERLKAAGMSIMPIMSPVARTTDTRFGKADDFAKQIEETCGEKIIDSIKAAEPIGPKALLDVLVIEPCTGNTLAKLANGIADTSVTMAAKAHLRNQRPLVIAVSTNDGLGCAAKNIGMLQNCKNIYFVPFRQDDPQLKHNSCISDFNLISETIKHALI
ncbi:MAG: dipicolinate synthase subunit B, partial [Acutalibacteraceae bacterium]|nr:dipicolinate synthase subunit B [Acutalibacteraceae bacterium]